MSILCGCSTGPAGECPPLAIEKGEGWDIHVHPQHCILPKKTDAVPGVHIRANICPSVRLRLFVEQVSLQPSAPPAPSHPDASRPIPSHPPHAVPCRPFLSCLSVRPYVCPSLRLSVRPIHDPCPLLNPMLRWLLPLAPRVGAWAKPLKSAPGACPHRACETLL